MAGIIDSLLPASGGQPPSETSAAPVADFGSRPTLILRGIASGQLPGAYVPKNAAPVKSDLTPEDLTQAGISIYKTRDPQVSAVLFNPETISEKQVAHLDTAGKITSVFPSTATLLAGPSGAPADAAAPTDGSGDSEAAMTVPVLPRPNFGGMSPATMTNSRMMALNGGSEPSKRLVPGAGKIINGLMERAV